ncbi:MAG: deoxyribodipyrimidine photo-lyase [Lysobacterales bacterium]
MSTAIVWFRRDLRLADNPALHAAVSAGHRVLPVYVHAPDEEAPWTPGAASAWWLHHSLQALDQQLRQRGSRLLICRGSSEQCLTQLIEASGAQALYWNRLYDPALTARDRVLKEGLRARGLEVRSYAGHLLAEPFELRTGAGEPYRVFTPFWRNLSGRVQAQTPLPAPARLDAPDIADALTVAQLGLLPTLPWDQGFYPEWTPGEAGALAALEVFIAQALDGYASGRDRPDQRGTSRLSPALHFGEISPRQIVHRLWGDASPGRRALAEPYLRELGWRDFGHHLLYHFPHTVHEPLQPGFAAFPWAEPVPERLAAWQRGRTGIPIVDAGMRELWSTGWMHNRVRMIVASLLTKNLRYHWLHGARWFWDTLVDADLANNTQGWQWSAGSGADAAPYFRIFNPIAQGERFDPDGRYVRRFVPELAKLSGAAVHQPWTIGGVRGYPKPIVDLKSSREAALAAYAQMRGKSVDAAMPG